MATRILATILLLTIGSIGLGAPAMAETLEQFYRRMAAKLTPDMLHPEGRYLVVVGDQSTVITRDQLLAAHKEQELIGAKTEILELQIISTSEVGNFISASIRMRTSQTLGAQKQVVEISGQELLLKKGDTFVSVFGLSTIK